MFPPGRFDTETPNVIDPGEMPPSRPTRIQSGSGQREFTFVPSAANASDTDGISKIYKAPLSRKTVRVALDADEEPDFLDDDDADDSEYGIISPIQNSTRPSSLANPILSPAAVKHEEARQFAEALLNASEERNYKKSRKDRRSNSSTPVGMLQTIRHMSMMQSGHDSMRSINLSDRQARKAVGLDDDPIFKARQQIRRKRTCRRICVLLTVVAILLAFGIAVFKALQERMVSSPTANNMAERMSATVDLLVEHGISKRQDLLMVSSPQYQAAYWMAYFDQEPLSIPISSSEEDQDLFRFVQRYVLAVFYYSLDGNNWVSALGFTSGVHECSWFEEVPDVTGDVFAVGVTCNENLHVRNLLIPSNNLKGRIPDEIRHLKKLDFLSLKHNDLSGTIPSSLNELTLLDYLDLKYNQLTGSIPHFLGDLQRLQVLGLSKNQLTGTLPGSLGTLHLKTLAVDDNLLTGDLAPIAMMTTLQYVYANDNEFIGKLDHGLLADLKSLIEADLSGNQIEAAHIPTHLFTLPQLRVLDLSDNDIMGSLPDSLPENSVLEYLSLRLNAIGSTIPETISNLRALTHLDLEANAFIGDLPTSLSALTDLAYLFLGKNPVTNGTIPHGFQSLTALRELSLDDLQLQGEIPEWIVDFTDLRLLDLRNNELTGPIQIDFSKLEGLTFLMLSDNKLTGPIPESLGSQTPLLVVSLHHNGLVGDASDLCRPESDIQLLTTDCGQITCDCCEECCDGDNCFEGVIWDALENNQPAWEEHFRRADYSFNPHIVFDQQ